MTRPNGNLVCPPACFDVDDRKNPFMTMQTPVDRDYSQRRQRRGHRDCCTFALGSGENPVIARYVATPNLRFPS
jgi:hypothetical protein